MRKIIRLVSYVGLAPLLISTIKTSRRTFLLLTILFPPIANTADPASNEEDEYIVDFDLGRDQDEVDPKEDDGVMRLGFKKKKSESNPAALLIENSKTKAKILIRITQDSDCCLSQNKVAMEYDSAAEVEWAKYKEYACWNLRNEILQKGYEKANNDSDKGRADYFSNSVTYVTKIMEAIGIKNADLGYWRASPTQLKRMVRNKEINPQPSKLSRR